MKGGRESRERVIILKDKNKHLFLIIKKKENELKINKYSGIIFKSFHIFKKNIRTIKFFFYLQF
jgi:hypothetical protein